MRSLLFLAVVAVLLVLTRAAPVQAGEPINEIGVMNPTMFKCVTVDGHQKELFQPDPWQKVVDSRRVFKRGGEEFDLPRLNEILSEYPNAREETCINELDVDYGFNPYDDKEFNAYLARLESQCRRAVREDEGDDDRARLVPITDTRIEGTVYEFHPRDPENPAESEWFAVPSKSVMVQAKGITFEIYWGSGEEGHYFFKDLGAGPIVINLQLPPDAHPINRDVVIFSNGLEETWTVLLGFYRGDVAPPNPELLRTPNGNFLPFITLADIENMSQCGSPDLPAVASRAFPPDTIGVSTAGMPDVGGVLEPEQSAGALALAGVMVLGLAVAGFVTMRSTGQPRPLPPPDNLAE